jgi:hypothetical protein
MKRKNQMRKVKRVKYRVNGIIIGMNKNGNGQKIEKVEDEKMWIVDECGK